MPTDQEMTAIEKIVCCSGRGRGGHMGKHQSRSAGSGARETTGGSLQGRKRGWGAGQSGLVLAGLGSFKGLYGREAVPSHVVSGPGVSRAGD